MPSKKIELTVEICFAILALSISLIIFNPISSYVEKFISEQKENLIAFVGEKTGVGFDYVSISPSILKHILIKKVSLFDYQSGQKIGEIENVQIEYNILSLIFGNFEDVIKYIKISDAYLELEKEKNKTIIEKIKTLTKKDEAELQNEESKQQKSNKLKTLFANLNPLEVVLENCAFLLKDESKEKEAIALNAKIKNASLQINQKKCFASISLESSYQTYNLSTPEKAIQNISCSFDGKGEFSKDLEEASFQGTILGSHSKYGSTAPLSLALLYSENKISISNLNQNSQNSFLFSFNLATKEVDGSIKCIAFKPFSLFKLNNIPKQYSQFENTAITTETSFHFKDKDIWNFNTKLDLILPSFKIGKFAIGKTKINTVSSGKNGELNVEFLNFSENRIDFALKGNYNLNTTKTNGALNISRLRLPTAQNLSSRVFFSGNKYAYKIEAPYINIATETIENVLLTILAKNNKYDFLLSLEDEGGKYGFDGSIVLAKNNFLDLHATLDSVRLSSILNIAKNITHNTEKIPENIEKIIRETQVTTEFYISTDFKNYSYNFIQVVLASTTQDALYATFQLNGNNSSVSLEKINFIANNIDLTGKAQAFFEKDSAAIEAFFSINSIAYNISAIYVDKSLSIYGDYGITINLFLKDEALKGAFVVTELPLPIIDSKLSLDTRFEIASFQNWSFECDMLKLSRGNDVSTVYGIYDVEMKGAGSQKGIEFNEIRVITNDLPLIGNLNISFDKLTEHSKNYNINTVLTLQNETTNELLTAKNELIISDKIYVDGKINLLNIALMRFFQGQTIRNVATAEINVLGSLDDFFIRLDIMSLNYSQKGEDVLLSGSFSADDRTIRIDSCNASWNSHTLTDIEGILSPFDALGNLSLYYNGKIGLKNLKTELNLVYSGGNKSVLGQEKIFATFPRLISNFSIEAIFSNIEYGDDVKIEKLHSLFVREPGVLAISAGNNDEVYGVYLDDGTVSLHVDEKLPIRCSVDGKINSEEIDLNCLGINIDIPLVWNILPFLHIVEFKSGTVVGDLKILGNAKEPEFHSNLKCVDVQATSKYYAPELYGPTDISVSLEGSTLTVPYTIVNGPSTKLYASVHSEFSGWIPAETIIKCGTVKGGFGLMKTKNLAFHSTGYASGDITMTITPGDFYLTGDATFNNGFFSIPFNDLHKLGNKPKKNGGMNFRMNLNVHLGKKAEYRWPNNEIPILRALIPSEEPIQLSLDTSLNYFDIKGASKIRGGEVFYVKRNFYIREGSVSFVSTLQSFEPFVSLRAEIRDKDENGEPIKIILTAKEQSLENFNPKIETFPPRSEAAVLQILGQVAIGNVSKNNFLQTALTTATDLVAQIGVLKKTESKIRDFLHLDTFSVRTLLLQNAVFGNLFKSNTDTPLTVGNYFDNTSVYIGKYFGSQIYADALLHLNYYDPLLAKGGVTRKPVYGNLLFMPELGLEMSTPFFLLRSSIAPTRADTLFVSDTKLTFSWKFAF